MHHDVPGKSRPSLDGTASWRFVAGMFELSPLLASASPRNARRTPREVIRFHSMTRCLLLALSGAMLLSAQPPQSFTRCAACHGDDARGTAQGPGLADESARRRAVRRAAARLSRARQSRRRHARLRRSARRRSDSRSPSYLRRINVDTIVGPAARRRTRPQNHVWGARSPATGSPTTATTPAIATVRSSRSPPRTSPR